MKAATVIALGWLTYLAIMLLMHYGHVSPIFGAGP